MRIMLQLDEWVRYVDDVDADVMRRGHIDVKIEPPLNLLVRPGLNVPKDKGVIVHFRYCGNSRGCIPIFTNKP